jgi:hypothetical protein
MLGCHEFCGYYEWTFHYMRRMFGQQSVRDLWAEAIGADSQRHYADAGLEGGLRGLLRVWVKTGEEEACDWTFTLDEEKNVLRWDMRRCPSKGFLIETDRNADEDYCDHCAGWVIPLMESIGGEMVVHEHNHCGQCWGVMRMKDRPAQLPDVSGDVRKDPRWNYGYIETWHAGRQVPSWPEWGDTADPATIIESRFADCDKIRLGARGAVLGESRVALAVCDQGYLKAAAVEPWAVVIGQEGVDLPALAARYQAAPADRRPLLVHPYWLAVPQVDFVSAALPRPVPLLPLLIRKGVYTHRPNGPRPDTRQLLRLMAQALGKPTIEEHHHE